MNDQADRGEKETDRVSSIVAPLVAEALEQTQLSKYHRPGGHRFVAEDANDFADKLRFRQAEITGRCNELNGPDRVVNGIQIQSKYFKTGRRDSRVIF